MDSDPTARWVRPAGGWPEWLWTVPYAGSHHPGADALPDLRGGANCQRYAYAVVGLFGLQVPPLRSSELWEERSLTTIGAVEDLVPLDLVLLSFSPDPYGAHVGVLMATDEVLHLSRTVGRPTVWSWEQLAERSAWSTFVGAKRCTGARGSASMQVGAGGPLS